MASFLTVSDFKRGQYLRGLDLAGLEDEHVNVLFTCSCCDSMYTPSAQKPFERKKDLGSAGNRIQGRGDNMKIFGLMVPSVTSKHMLCNWSSTSISKYHQGRFIHVPINQVISSATGHKAMLKIPTGFPKVPAAPGSSKTFGDLPQEILDKIFLLAVEPRVFRARESERWEMTEVGSVLLHDFQVFDTPLPSTMFINKKIGRELLKYYKPMFRTINGGRPVLFNKDIDILELQGIFHHLPSSKIHNALFAKQLVAPQELSFINRLLLDIDEVVNNWFWVFYNLLTLKTLQELTVNASFRVPIAGCPFGVRVLMDKVPNKAEFQFKGLLDGDSVLEPLPRESKDEKLSPQKKCLVMRWLVPQDQAQMAVLLDNLETFLVSSEISLPRVILQINCTPISDLQ